MRTDRLSNYRCQIDIDLTSYDVTFTHWRQIVADFVPCFFFKRHICFWMSAIVAIIPHGLLGKIVEVIGHRFLHGLLP